MFEDVKEKMSEFYQKLGGYVAELENERVMNAFVGSKILEFQIKKIPNRKTLYELYMKTDATSVPRLKTAVKNGEVIVYEENMEFYIPSELRLKVKLS